ncbi:uncharacterized protein FOMMEDRAFT_109473 [Fomitiporia mediterranea MF3/22]|uniref:uncharacterized protein n=1 Tax=Fomitiporia mediterranea (strain MF3/22) TaxID=694068 RepID=UPI000440950A|nr:uncharacterized protein FOMMEDRAFT_109473 [Fomitiporia mediterranea MF3/22]EJD02230.1 hypothetical protein FOMMEDRAFT_109473 [Fomitiporia mediterranea MF3/22]
MVADNSSVQCAQAGQRPSTSAFTRPFPPPALVGVPLPYILEQLHNLAVTYWDKPQTADCTIIVPIVPQRHFARNSTDCSSNNIFGPSGSGRLATEPVPPMTRPTRMTSKLHLDYLLAQSSLFRDLFSGRPLSESMAPTCPDSPNTPPALPRVALPPHRRPHIMPSVPSHPIVYLPLPDPSSFPHLVHFMYFGTFEVLESALDAGTVQWADVVRNVEYLGMRSRVKAFLGRWYSQRMGPGVPPIVCGDDGDELGYGSDFEEDESSSDEEDEDAYSDFDDDDSDASLSDTDGSLETLVDDEPLSALSSKTSCDDVRMMDMSIEDEPPRGRSRTRNSPRAATFSPVRKHRS